MTENNQPSNNSNSNDFKVLAEWTVHGYDQQERGRRWYVVAITVALILLLISFLTGNFLFAVIIIITALIFILNEGNAPLEVKIKITDEGIFVGKKFIDYDDIKNFAIVYKPSQNIKNLYLNFQNIFLHRTTIPLEDRNPLHIREILLRYLSEDLDQTDPPLSEQIARMLKL